MAIGWGTMGSPGVHIVLASWFERRRGLVLSIALTGTTLGGVVLAPTLAWLIERVGFGHALSVAGLAIFVVLAAVGRVMRRGPEEIGLHRDGDARPSIPSEHVDAGGSWRSRSLLTWRFWSLAAPFAVGYAVLVGVLTHLVGVAGPVLQGDATARLLGVTTTAALAIRIALGQVVDRLDARFVSCATFLTQAVGLAVLGTRRSELAVYLGCTLLGVGLGSLILLPGLIASKEWPREHFGAIVSKVSLFIQIAIAFGPSLVAALRNWSGRYEPALIACAALNMVAAAAALLRPKDSPSAREGA
jgi:sugar phosphate permease